MWTKDETGTLINLAFVHFIDVQEIEDPSEEQLAAGKTHVVAAGREDDVSWWLDTGTEEHCRKVLGIFANKLSAL